MADLPQLKNIKSKGKGHTNYSFPVLCTSYVRSDSNRLVLFIHTVRETYVTLPATWKGSQFLYLNR